MKGRLVACLCVLHLVYLPKSKNKVVSLGPFILGEWALYFCIYDKQEGIRNHMLPTLDTIIFKYLSFFLFFGMKRGGGGEVEL